MNELFILVGNGTYDNRGFEAIVRGTVEIIARYYESPRFVVCGNYWSTQQFERLTRREKDARIRHARMKRLPVFRRVLLKSSFDRLCRLFPRQRREYKFAEISDLIPRAEAVLSIGGNSYSLDYGRPGDFTDLDELVRARGGKLVIWGSSVGPFSADPAYERFMTGHLNRLPAIFCRESNSLEYLKRIDVEKNVFKVCDPAYVLMPEEPIDATLYNDLGRAIGVNLSPVMARYVTGGDADAWLETATQIVKGIASLGYPVVLVPHVFEPGNDDYAFMKRIAARLAFDAVTVVSPDHTAAELKWLIGRMMLFCGCHTHACIAAMTSHVPTVSLSYSPKSLGIHHDIFGHSGYCVSGEDISALTVLLAVTNALRNREHIVEVLERQMGDMVWDAYKNGKLLKSICITGQEAVRPRGRAWEFIERIRRFGLYRAPKLLTH